MARYRWRVRATDEAKATLLASELNISPVLARVLVARGYTDPEAAYRFLNPALHDLSDPKRLPDIEPAVRRLARAVERQEPVLVYGDYDVDGVTATALWLTTLRKLGVPAEPYIPHREREGYDLHPNAIEAAQRIGAQLVLTCDCGTRAHHAVDALNAAGLEVVITDHHEPSDRLPNALAVVNPKRIDSHYPFHELSGVGVSFRVAEALLKERKLARNGFYDTMLDLVALGTVADVVPLIGENRILVKQGLEQLHRTKRVGLQALKRVAGVKGKPTARDIGFGLAPRMNAAGRLEDARLALQLLLTDDPIDAQEIAQTLNDHNRTRQQLQEAAVQEAIDQIERENLTRHRALVVHSPNWRHGIVGLVAGKLMNRYYRPVAAVTIEEGVARGSMRSIPEFSLTELLAQMKPVCLKCGGHEAAGGFAVALEWFDDLRDLITAFANAHLTDDDLIPTLDIDQEIAPSEATLRLIQELSMMEPFGAGNERPQFLCRDVEVLGSRTDRSGKHLFLTVREADGVATDAVLWDGGDYPIEPQTRVDLVFDLEEDTYYGYGATRWVIKDFEEQV
ncbi:MAG: single-stranded-DNA-specific exonuclease RecJ [Armatimonadetes bacterium]|nr:single-stranded-DNA-specific exonuclease RecJ [Armatimonadota bacterium]